MSPIISSRAKEEFMWLLLLRTSVETLFGAAVNGVEVDIENLEFSKCCGVARYHLDINKRGATEGVDGTILAILASTVR